MSEWFQPKPLRYLVVLAVDAVGGRGAVVGFVIVARDGQAPHTRSHNARPCRTRTLRPFHQKRGKNTTQFEIKVGALDGRWLVLNEKKKEAGCWLRTAVALDIIPRNVDIIPRVNCDPDPIPLKVGIDDVDIVVPDLVKQTRQSFSQNWLKFTKNSRHLSQNLLTWSMAGAAESHSPMSARRRA